MPRPDYGLLFLIAACMALFLLVIVILVGMFLLPFVLFETISRKPARDLVRNGRPNELQKSHSLTAKLCQRNGELRTHLRHNLCPVGIPTSRS